MDSVHQVRRQPLDSDCFHRAKTALRHLQREQALLQQQAAALPGGKRSLVDRIMQVVRPDYDDATRARVLAMPSIAYRLALAAAGEVDLAVSLTQGLDAYDVSVR